MGVRPINDILVLRAHEAHLSGHCLTIHATIQVPLDNYDMVNETMDEYASKKSCKHVVKEMHNKVISKYRRYMN